MTTSNLYIAHSTPSTGAPSSTAGSPRPNTPSPSSSADPPPSRALLILQSPTTRKHLDRIHTVSGSAIKLSNKAAAAVESLIHDSALSAVAVAPALVATVLPFPPRRTNLPGSHSISRITNPTFVHHSPCPPRSLDNSSFRLHFSRCDGLCRLWVDQA